ncbi:MAG: hypothetical protein P8P83_03710 [Rickettsiaceae bacterium]|nr:hypothetical protein [Rickettsiaceae bacterium]
MIEEQKHQLLNRTFARRVGKALSDLKQNLVDHELPKHLYSTERLTTNKYDKVFLEIGFGMGEHFVHQVKSNPDSLYIGAEVYINGVANALKQVQSCDNFMIWPDDLDLVLNKIPHGLLDGIYVLFPDPWHKRRALKKRLFNNVRLESFKAILKKNGFIAFASDIIDYTESVHELLNSDKDFIIQNTDLTIPHDGYIQTKYHSKGLKEGRNPQFIQAQLK